mmetsp:Transcript_1720/g.2614  ORF Transcript_1720/g.2614 Transcript_1720/m.2614 type:complete len:358 (-) Transcript_1720:124-1197(-)
MAVAATHFLALSLLLFIRCYLIGANSNNDIPNPYIEVKSFWGAPINPLYINEKVDPYSTVGFEPWPDDPKEAEHFCRKFAQNPSTSQTSWNDFSILRLSGLSNGADDTLSGGAELWGLVYRDGSYTTPNPNYFGTSRVRMRLMHLDPEYMGATHLCVFVGRVLNPEAGNGDKEPPMGLFSDIDFLLPPFMLRGVECKIPMVATVQLTAFAHNSLIFKSEKDFQNFQDRVKTEIPSTLRKFHEQMPQFIRQKFGSDLGISNSPPFAKPQSFRAQRWFDKTQATVAQLSGIIRKVDVKTNRHTGKTFYWALLDCGEGLIIDVVLHPRLIDENWPPRPGGVIYGVFYLQGVILPDNDTKR